MFKSIRTNLTVYNFFIIFLVTGSFLMVSHVLMNEYFWEEERSNLEALSYHTGVEIDSFIQNEKSMMKRIASGREVVDFPRNYRVPALADYFDKFRERLPVLSYINSEGKEEVKMVNGRISDKSQDYDKNAFVLEARRHPNDVVIAPVGMSRELREPVIQMALARYRYFGDEYEGTILGQIPLKSVRAITEHVKIGKTGFVLVMDTDGNIIIGSKGSFMKKISGGEDTEKLIAGASAKGLGFTRAIIDGIDSLVAYGPVNSQNWSVLAVLPYSEFIRSPNRIRNVSIATFAIICLIGWGLVYWLSKRITNPILQISKASQKIFVSGDLPDTIDIVADDETGQLVDSFNNMVVRLGETTISRDYMDSILSSMNESLIITSMSGVIQKVNRATCGMLGYEEREITGKNISDIIDGERFDIKELPGYCSGEKSVFKLESVYLTKSGKKVPVIFSASPLCDRKRSLNSIVCLAIDISDRIRSEEQVRYLAYYDDLTGLTNRTLFKDRMEFLIKTCDREEKIAAVLFVDIDNFKKINDSLGHRCGDELLQHIGKRLMGSLRNTDMVSRAHTGESGNLVSRFGGDEFTVLLTELQNIEDCAAVARRILKETSKPFIICDTEIFVTLSIGISVFPFDSTDPQELVKYADIAMYRVKEDGKNNFRFFEQSMNVGVQKRHIMESNLRKALIRDEFLLYYQPQLNLRSGEIIGMEALIRWKSPDLGMVSPGDFIPMAEETGLIYPIGEWVLHTACRQVKEWYAAGLPPVSVSVNISGLQFRERDFIGTLSKIIRTAEMDPQRLILEITESVMMENSEQVAGILKVFNSQGIRFAIDDFGTGYSSLSYLKRFPLYAIKIDRSFLKDLTVNSDDAAIVRAVIDMIHSLKLKVVAEGVETEEQETFLRENSCDEIQGYIVSPPVPAEKATEILRAGRHLKYGSPLDGRTEKIGQNTTLKIGLTPDEGYDI